MPSRSGEKGIIINTCERAVSGDINRLQSLGGKALQEALRFMLNVGTGLDDVNAGGLNLETVTGTIPPAAEVLGGLMVRPDPMGGTLNLLVDDGLLCMVDLDAFPSADDSVYKYCRSAGLAIGTLAMTANPTSGSSGARIDVIECQRVDDPNPEQDNRNVFNPTTNQFTAQTVTKTVASALAFRVRLGAMGGAFPGCRAGWVPLCIAHVPVGALTNDAMTFWDVRPLLGDRAIGVQNGAVDLPKVTRCLAQIDGVNYVGQSRLSGVIEATLGSRRLGGMLRASTPAAASGDDTYYVDLDDAANQDLSAPPAAGLSYVYLCTPYGLPRWARYTVGPAGRVPRSPRGVLVASAIAPDLVYGTVPASTPITLPPCFQDTLNQQTVSGQQTVCVLARIGTSSLPSSAAKGLVASGRVHHLSNPTAANTGTIAGSGSGTYATFVLVPGTDFPAHARAIRASVVTTYTGLGDTAGQAYSLALTGIGTILPNLVPDGGMPVPIAGSSGSSTFQHNLRVPIPSMYGLAGAPGASTPGDSQTVQLVVSGAPKEMTDATLVVTGWELADAD